MRCMAGGVGGMVYGGSFSNGDHLGYGKFCYDWILTGFFMLQFHDDIDNKNHPACPPDDSRLFCHNYFVIIV